MARPLTASFIKESLKQEIGSPFVNLVTLSHTSLAVPLRFTNAGADITSRGDLYTYVPFEIGFPDETDDAPPRARLSISNVEQTVMATIRSVFDDVFVTNELIESDFPDDVVAVFPNFELIDVKWNQFAISGELDIGGYFREPCPFQRINPGDYPGNH